jgi:hypothetical protein
MTTLYATMDELLAEMEVFVSEYYGYDSASWRSGDFAAGALIEFKARQGDGQIGHWTVEDLRHFMLGWFPRTVLTDEGVRRDVPDCAAVFFRFMAARGSLSGDGLWALEAACSRLRDPFLRSCRDPRDWNASKQSLSRIVARPGRARTSGRRPALRRTRAAGGGRIRCNAASPRCDGRGRAAR